MGVVAGPITRRISQSSGDLAFDRPAGDPAGMQHFDRYLTINGKPAFHIGNICGTCEFLFERLSGANVPSLAPREIARRLGDGLDTLDPDLIESASRILPSGQYRVSLLEVSPLRVTLGSTRDYFSNEQVRLWGLDRFYGLPHYPRVEYCRSLTKAFGREEGLFEFVIPMYAQTWLNPEQMEYYQGRLASGSWPTAMALSVLDIKQPADWDDPQPITKHWCLAHYLLDGHHKTFAAALWHRPITLLSFLAVDECLASPDDIDTLFQVLA